MNTVLFVDDEPRILQGLQRQLHNMRHEWDMEFTDSGAKALEHLARKPAEIIVSDMFMPAMDGARFLTEVAKSHPQTIRFILSGHGNREAALHLVGPAHQYLSKPCNPEELRSAISRALALRNLLSSNQLKELASGLRSLPSLPAMQQELTAEICREQPSLERAAEIISRDLGLTTKILQVVNSAFFGLSQPMANPFEAICFLGVATVRALALSIHVFSEFNAGSIHEFSSEQLARHCWGIAVAARKISELQEGSAQLNEQCFLAGLLHDVGQLILASGMPKRYGPVLHAAAQTSRPIWEVEREEFGATHAEVGAYLLGLWGLPNPVVEAVAFHHCPAQGAERGFSPVIAVHVADIFAHESDAAAGPRPGYQLDLATLGALGLESHIAEWRERCFAAA